MTRLHQTGSVWTSDYEGDMYSIDGQTVVLCSTGCVRLHDYSSDEGMIIKDNNIIQKVQRAVEEDKAEQDRRARRAVELSRGDAIMESVMLRHLSYTDGREGDPMVVGPHRLWPVGRNAGGDFYIGVTDGQRVVFYADDSAFDEETGTPLVSKVHPVDGWGYLGHG